LAFERRANNGNWAFIDIFRAIESEKLLQKKKQQLSKKEAKLKAANFCAYQERSQKELRNKLYDYGLYSEEVEEVISELIVDGYINEERFAKQYVGGKFRMKKWGRIRISIGLKKHNISAYCQKQGMKEIEDDDYTDTLKGIILKKASTEKEVNLFKRRNKIAKYAISKGFEPELVWAVLKEVIAD